MATDLERLTVSLEANVKKFEREMARARGVAVKAMKDVEDRAGGIESAISKSFGRIGSVMQKAFAGIAAGLSLNELRKAADQYTGIINTLKVAGVSGGALSGVFDQLFASAQRNAVPLDALAQLYGRVSQAQTTLKASSGELLGLTDIVAQSLRVSGTSATEASGSLLQLAQSLSGGKVQAEEYNSLLDGMYPLLQAAAAGLKEAGGDVSKLTALVKDGKVSSEAFFRAIQAGAPVIEQKLAGSVLTTDQAMQKLRNEFVKAVGEFDKATGVSLGLAASLDTVAGSIGGIGRAATTAVTGVQSLLTKIGELYAANGAVLRQQGLIQGQERAAMRAQGREMGLANAGGRDGLANDRATASDIATEASRRALQGFRQSEIGYANQLRTAPLPPPRPAGAGANVKPISLADYKVPGDKDGKGGGSSKEKLDAYEKELIQIEKRTKALHLEAEMVGRSTFEREKARAALELETAAKKANIPVTDEMRAAIDRAATGYANAKVRVEEVTKALDAVRDAQQFAGQELTDAFSDAVLEGKKAEEVVLNLAKALAKAALQASFMGTGPLAGLFGTAGTNGATGGLFGALFSSIGGKADGGWMSGPGTGRSDSILARLSDGEHVTNARSAAKYAPLLDAINKDRLPKFAKGGFVGMPSLSAPQVPAGIGSRGLGGGSGSPIAVHFAIDARGATPDAVAALRVELARLESSLPGVIMQTQSEARRRGATR